MPFLRGQRKRRYVRTLISAILIWVATGGLWLFSSAHADSLAGFASLYDKDAGSLLTFPLLAFPFLRVTPGPRPSASSSYTATHYVAPFASVAGASSDFDAQDSNAWDGAAASNETPVACTMACAMANAVAGSIVQCAAGSYLGTGGAAWTPTWYPANNGTEGNEIIFFAETPAATNAGSPASLSKLKSATTTVPTYGGLGYAGTNTHDVIWDGFWCDQADGSYPVASVGQCSIGGGTTRIQIRRALFDRGDIGGGDNFAAIFMQQTDTITVSDCLFRGGANEGGGGSHNNGAISFYNCEDFLGEYNTFEDMECGIFVKAHRDSADGNTGIIRYNLFSNCSVNGIEFNEVDNAKGGMDFYQNLLLLSGIKFDWSSDVTGKAVRIFNNTIVDPNDSGEAPLQLYPTVGEAGMAFRDNIVVRSTSGNMVYMHANDFYPGFTTLWNRNCWYNSAAALAFQNNGRYLTFTSGGTYQVQVGDLLEANTSTWDRYVYDGTAASVGASTLVLNVDASDYSDDYFNGYRVTVTAATTGNGATGTITDYVASTQTCTLTWSVQPTGTVEFTIEEADLPCAATVTRVDLVSGSWAGGDAAGVILVEQVTSGNFAAAETANVGGNTNVLTAAGNYTTIGNVNFTNWKAYTGVDADSISSDPEFVGGGDYRLANNGQAARTASTTGGKLGCYLTDDEEIGVRTVPMYA